MPDLSLARALPHAWPAYAKRDQGGLDQALNNNLSPIETYQKVREIPNNDLSILSYLEDTGRPAFTAAPSYDFGGFI